MKGSDGKEQTVTVATKDTNTYTIGGKYDAATKTIKFTRSDNATYDVDISDVVSSVTGDTRNTIVDSDTAVSYTHLDVYKRQTRWNTMKKFLKPPNHIGPI